MRLNRPVCRVSRIGKATMDSSVKMAARKARVTAVLSSPQESSFDWFTESKTSPSHRIVEVLRFLCLILRRSHWDVSSLSHAESSLGNWINCGCQSDISTRLSRIPKTWGVVVERVSRPSETRWIIFWHSSHRIL